MPPKYSLSGNSRRKSVFQSAINNSSLSETSAQAVELERLEQEITLTLQDIDKSFAQSHKIINDKLIPIVKKYHSNSRKVWNGVNFWKTMLETSANVELRGYEEAAQEVSQRRDISDDSGDISMKDSNEQMSPVKVDTLGTNHDIILESTNHTQEQFQKRYTDNLNRSVSTAMSTPEKIAENPIMPQETRNNNVGFDTTDSILPPVPTANISNTNNGSDLNETTPSLRDKESRNYIMHQNGDSVYKVEVSPRKTTGVNEPIVSSMTPKKPASKKRKSMIAQKFDSSPFDIETPQLRSEVQFSPAKKYESPVRKTRQSLPMGNDETTQRFPLTPRYGGGGNLLRTPGQVAQAANTYSQNFETSIQRGTTAPTLDDSEDAPNISPPVTLNFATAGNPQALKHTTAREAAQSIVKDILNNVSGINDSTHDQSFHDAPSHILPEPTSTQDKLEDFDEYLDKAPKDRAKNLDWSDDDN